MIVMLGNTFVCCIFCAFLFLHKNVCISFIHTSNRVGKTDDLLLIRRHSSSFLLHAQFSKSSQNGYASHDRVDRIIKTVFGSFRGTSIIDILRSVSKTEGPLTGVELLEVMCKFIDRRDYIRFSDILIPYVTVSKNELLMTSGHDDRKLIMVDGRRSRFGDKFPAVEQSLPAMTDLSSKVDLHSVEDKNKKGVAADEYLRILDLNVLMLLTYSIQQMKPKRRKIQSLALLQRAIDARVDRITIATQILSIMTSLDYLSIDETTCSISLLRLVAQFMRDNSLSSQGNPSRWAPHDMTIVEIEAASCEERERSSVMSTRDFIPSEVYLSAIAHTPSWNKVNDVMTEFKQHKSWKDSYQRLDVVTCLNVIHGTVLDKFLNLLTLKKLRVLHSDGQIDTDSSIYTESLGLVRHLLTHRTGQEKEDVILSEPTEGDRDSGIIGDRECLFVYQPTPSLDDVRDFIGCKEENTEESLFVCDSRLSKAILLTQLPDRSADDVAEELDQESLYAPYCSYLESVLAAAHSDSLVNETVVLGSEVDSEIISTSDSKGSSDNNHTSRVRAVRVLVLGDGDLSFSASLLKMAVEAGDVNADSDTEGTDLGDSDNADDVIEERGKDMYEANQNLALESRPRISSSGSQSQSKDDINESENSRQRYSMRLDVTATTFESPSSLVAKYEDAEENIEFIESAVSRYPLAQYGQNGSRKSEGDETDVARDESEVVQAHSSVASVSAVQSRGSGSSSGRVMYNVDATRLNKGDFSGGSFDAVIFNFPFGDAVSARDSSRASEGAGVEAGAGAGVGVTAGVGAGEDPTVSGGGGEDRGPLSSRYLDDTRQESSMHGSSLEGKDRGEDEKEEVIEIEGVGEGVTGVEDTARTLPPKGSRVKSKGDPEVSVQKSKSKLKSDDFDTHWVARGRHMHLIEGVFRSAKNILYLPEYCDMDGDGDNSGCGSRSSSGCDSDRIREDDFDSKIDGDSERDRNRNRGEQRGSINSKSPYPTSEIVSENSHNQDLSTTPHVQSGGGPRVMITLLLSQAQEWEVERIARDQGFSLSEILPFEDLVFSNRGYSRKRTYADDIFPSSSSTSSSSTSSSSPSSSTSSSASANCSFNRTADQDSDEDGVSNTVSSHTKSRQQNVRAAQESYVLQRKKWRQSIVVAWTFVFTHTR
jgi:Domain of unknown function (DUF2431)